MGTALAWGYRYIKVEPSHFRVEYQINPFMDTADQPDPVRARAQWDTLVATIERLGGTVDVHRPARGRARHGLRDEPRPRRRDRRTAATTSCSATCATRSAGWRPPRRRHWFLDNGFTTSYVGSDGVGAHFEAGDAFAFGDALVVGYGPRTEELGLKHLAAGPAASGCGASGSPTRGCTTSTSRSARSARPAPSSARPRSTTPRPRAARPGPRAAGASPRRRRWTFCANSIVIGSTILMPACPRPGPCAARGVGLRDRRRRRLGVPQGRRVDPLHDQPGGPADRPRPRGRARRRRRPALTGRGPQRGGLGSEGEHSPAPLPPAGHAGVRRRPAPGRPSRSPRLQALLEREPLPAAARRPRGRGRQRRADEPLPRHGLLRALRRTRGPPRVSPRPGWPWPPGRSPLLYQLLRRCAIPGTRWSTPGARSRPTRSPSRPRQPRRSGCR